MGWWGGGGVGDCSTGKTAEQNAEFVTRKPLGENPRITLCRRVHYIYRVDHPSIFPKSRVREDRPETEGEEACLGGRDIGLHVKGIAVSKGMTF